jgi:o-succinylbenzoate synthase
VKLARARLTPFALPLRAPLRAARGVAWERRGVLVALESGDGLVGFGEATPPEGFGAESPAECLARGGELVRMLVESDARALDAQLARVDAGAAGAPAIRFAVETALFDLAARARGVPLADLLAGGRATRRGVALNALLQANEPDAAAIEARRAVGDGFETLKLKVGAGDPGEDCARVRAVRAAVGNEAELRLDANGAWDADLAIAILRELDGANLELAEQPVAPADVAGLARVRAAVLVPIAADESIADPARAAAVLEQRAADTLVLKPAVLGGLRASLALAARARAAGVRVFVTTGLDGAIARAAALALAAALPGPLPACGLATGAWLAEDIGAGPEPKDGSLELCEEPGLGAAPSDAALESLATGATLEWSR